MPARSWFGRSVAWAIRVDGRPHAKSPDFLGNAYQWRGYAWIADPQVGDIAQWDAGYDGADGLGHVAYIVGVNPDSTLTLYEYNWIRFHRFDIRTIDRDAPSRYMRF